MANAIRARVPKARFGLPDTAGDPTWSSRIAERLAAMPPAGTGARRSGKPSQHRRRHPPLLLRRPAHQPRRSTSPHILQTDPKVAKVAGTTREAAEKLGCVYRMTEGNTCYQGGKPNVSDVFAAALWAADYALSLATFGYAGINLHGGGGKAVGNSLGAACPAKPSSSPAKPRTPAPSTPPSPT